MSVGSFLRCIFLARQELIGTLFSPRTRYLLIYLPFSRACDLLARAHPPLPFSQHPPSLQLSHTRLARRRFSIFRHRSRSLMFLSLPAPSLTHHHPDASFPPWGGDQAVLRRISITSFTDSRCEFSAKAFSPKMNRSSHRFPRCPLQGLRLPPEDPRTNGVDPRPLPSERLTRHPNSPKTPIVRVLKNSLFLSPSISR